MTCRHVLGLIDAGPFSGYPRAHLDAAWSHAASCPTCGPALTASRALTTRLRGLPHPAAPAHLQTTVMARIAAMAPERNAENAAASAATTHERSTAPDWSSWVSIGGLAIGFAVVAVVHGPPTNVAIIWNGLNVSDFRGADTAIGALALVCGLALYVAGLLAPVGWRRRT